MAFAAAEQDRSEPDDFVHAVYRDGLTAEQLDRENTGEEDAIILEPGEGYFVNETLLTCAACLWGAGNVVVYPDEPELHSFRHEWILRRLPRPVVPSPVHKPLPHKKHTPEEQSPDPKTHVFSGFSPAMRLHGFLR